MDCVTDEIALPAFAALEGPAVGENFVADLCGSLACGEGSCDALPADGTDNLIHAALGLSRAVEEEIDVGAGAQACEWVTQDTHCAAHDCCNVDFVFYIE